MYLIATGWRLYSVGIVMVKQHSAWLLGKPIVWSALNYHSLIFRLLLRLCNSTSNGTNMQLHNYAVTSSMSRDSDPRPLVYYQSWLFRYSCMNYNMIHAQCVHVAPGDWLESELRIANDSACHLAVYLTSETRGLNWVTVIIKFQYKCRDNSSK